MIVLSDEFLEVLLDEQSGALRRLTDRKRHIVLAQSELSQPFLLEYSQNEFSGSFAGFIATSEAPTSATLCWQIEPGIQLTARLTLKDGSLAFSARVNNSTQKVLCSIEYPILDGFQALQPGKDHLAHSYATGYLVHDPLENFPNDGDGMRYMPYPEGFSGATMQFFSYYSDRLTGLLFAAYDSSYRQKWLNFYKQGGALRASQVFGYEDIAPGKPLVADWAFTVTLTDGNGWYEAAELYRNWALSQKWCSRGPLEQLPEDKKASWLLEKVGAATFGINACHNRTRWLKQYSTDIGAPVFHILGPDWPQVDQNYQGSLPGGYQDWFPTRFSKENLETIRQQGDYWAPFEFDFLLAVDKADSEKIHASLQQWPEIPKARDGYTFSMLCPLCSYTKELHRERDRQVVRESDCDAMYYDISANNIIKTCMSAEHGHGVGAGQAMTDAYRDIYADTKTAIAKDRNHYFPLGTEMINEVFLDRLDYYQARANAQPCSTLETWPFRELLKAGKSELIPMFHYVYSGYAPVRLDGWGKLVEEGGDQIWHTIAKTYLWGGLFEINSEYSPMELLDGVENSSEEHYCKLEPRGYAYQPALAQYIGKFAALRTGNLGHFLTYGRMQPPPALDCKKVLRSWYQYNHGEGAREQNDRGVLALDSVLTSRYHHNGEGAVFLANTTAFAQEISLGELAPTGVSDCQLWVDYHKGAQATSAKVAALKQLTLQPYQLTVLTYQLPSSQI